MAKTTPPPNAVYDDPAYLAIAGDPALYLRFANDLLSAFDLPRGRLLDIGCGGGYILQAASDLGYEAIGVDVNPASIEACSKRNLEAIRPNEITGQFQVIVLSHVLEHLDHPISQHI